MSADELVQGAEDVLVVVTRWMGGGQIGNDRFRLINVVINNLVVFLESVRS